MIRLEAVLLFDIPSTLGLLFFWQYAYGDLYISVDIQKGSLNLPSAPLYGFYKVGSFLWPNNHQLIITINHLFMISRKLQHSSLLLHSLLYIFRVSSTAYIYQANLYSAVIIFITLSLKSSCRRSQRKYKVLLLMPVRYFLFTQSVSEHYKSRHI